MLKKDNIKNFLRNPLGVIALFVTICYLIAGLVFSIGLDKLNGAEERLPFIWFIIIFPVIIFVVFVLLVCFHHEKLYGPTDFKDEANFIKLTKEQEENLRTVSKEAIKLEGQFDMDAYNEKFEKTEKSVQKEEEEKAQEEPVAVTEEEKDQEDLLNSIDYIKSVLGLNMVEQQAQENAEEKEK